MDNNISNYYRIYNKSFYNTTQKEETEIMTKEDIRKGMVLYYARILRPVGMYEVIELLIRTVEDDYFVGVDKRDKHAYLFSYNNLNKLIFSDRQECLDIVLDAEKNAPKISNEKEYEEY